jgi:hypothetical protein
MDNIKNCKKIAGSNIHKYECSHSEFLMDRAEIYAHLFFCHR